MEEIREGVNNMNLAVETQKKNRIQVSNTKKPLFFYANLAKSTLISVKYMYRIVHVVSSAGALAIATVVTVAEILKNNGFAVEKTIATVVTFVEILMNNGFAVEKSNMSFKS